MAGRPRRIDTLHLPYRPTAIGWRHCTWSMSADLGNLRSAYLACVPVDFITGAVGEKYVAQVLIMRLQLAQRATYADQFDFACEVIEYVKLPEPAVSDPSAAYMNHSQRQCQLTVQAGCAAVRHRPVALTIQSDRFLLDPNSEEGMAREPRSDDQVDRFVFNPAGIVFDPMILNKAFQTLPG